MGRLAKSHSPTGLLGCGGACVLMLFTQNVGHRPVPFSAIGLPGPSKSYNAPTLSIVYSLLCSTSTACAITMTRDFLLTPGSISRLAGLASLASDRAITAANTRAAPAPKSTVFLLSCLLAQVLAFCHTAHDNPVHTLDLARLGTFG